MAHRTLAPSSNPSSRSLEPNPSVIMNGILATVQSSSIPIKDAIDVFVQGLQDPFEPSYCGVCIVGCILAIYPSLMRTQDIPTIHHSFWSTAISFLTVNRPPGYIEVLALRLSQCTCPTGRGTTIDKLHLLTKSFSIFNSRRGVLGSLAIIVVQLNNMFGRLLKQVKPTTVAKGRHTELWPTSPHDLVPHG